MTTQIIRPNATASIYGTLHGVPDWHTAPYPLTDMYWNTNVDEEVLSETDYLSANTSENGLVCRFVNPVTGGAISKVTVTAVCRSASGSVRFWIYNLSGDSYLSSWQDVDTGVNQTLSVSWTTNPVTGLDWTWSDINSITAGVRLISGDGNIYCYQLYITITYTPVVPTVTTRQETDQHTTSVTGNGVITATGGDTITRRGFCYTTEDIDPTTSDSKAYDDGTWTSISNFTKSITSLTAGTTYNVRAFATNSAGTGYGTTVQITTVSDGTVTWTNTPYSAFSSAEFRGGEKFGTKLYVVIGANVLSITTAGVISILGVITTSTGNVFMAYNGTQILIVDGTAYGHYITAATGVLSDITDADFPASSSCAFADGYFVVTKTSTGQFFISGLYDAATWDALDFATAEGSPDNLVRCYYGNSNLWLFGTDTIEVWYNSGGTDFPFTRISGALIEDGLAGSAAICMIKDQFYFLSNKLEVLRTVGYQREKISTIHIDTEIQSYTTVSDVVLYEYRTDGHVFLVVTFPTADKTWVYDITTNYWHEWQSYKTQGVATYGRHRGAIGFFFNNKYVVGDYSNGFLYELDMATYTDNGEAIPRTRRTQIIDKDRLKVIHHSVELDFDFGQGSSPSVLLRWSDDEANTWSTGRTMSLGALRAYTVRAKENRLGCSRNRVYEITTSTNSRFVLLAAYAELEALKS
jgi:hypothetical protein